MLKVMSVVIVGLALFVAIGLNPPPAKRILFIGNSFTFGGNVPLQAKNIAASSDPSVDYYVEMVVQGGTSLEEHLTETDALAKIEDGHWDVVVLQDSSVMSFRPEWIANMEGAAVILAGAAQQQGAEVLYFAHWAPDWAPVTQAYSPSEAIGIIEQTYEQVAQITGGRVARVGRLWQIAGDAGLDGLYSDDEHHASVKGAYAAALAITVALGDIDVTTSSWAPEAVPLVEQEQLRTAASTLPMDARPTVHGAIN